MSIWHSTFPSTRVFLARDGAQTEIRALAQFSQDPLLVKQLNAGEDIHSQVAHAVFNWSLEKVKKDKKVRRIAKELHFGIIFGLKPPGIYQRCLRMGMDDISLRDIEDAYYSYARKYSTVWDWRTYAIEYAAENHRTIPTFFGRQRDLNIYSGPDKEGAFWENQAVNTPIQGLASDWLLLAMAIIHTEEKYRDVEDVLSNEVHDSLWTCPTLEELKVIDRKLQTAMDDDTAEQSFTRFGLKMVVPLISEAVFGFRAGVMIPFDRKKLLDDSLREWIVKNAEVEQIFETNPLSFVKIVEGRA